MRRERIQLVHAHSRIAAVVASVACLYRIPLVVTSHILPQGFSRVSQWGDSTICVSEAVRRRLIEGYDSRPARPRSFITEWKPEATPLSFASDLDR